MTNMLQDGVTCLGTWLKDHAGVTLTYTRGANSVAITGTVSLHEYQVADAEGIITVVNSRDYIVHAADLIISGAEITPRAGDRIAETIDSTVNTFEVMSIDGTRAFEPVDPDNVLLKIHTKRIS